MKGETKAPLQLKDPVCGSGVRVRWGCMRDKGESLIIRSGNGAAAGMQGEATLMGQCNLRFFA